MAAALLRAVCTRRPLLCPRDGAAVDISARRREGTLEYYRRPEEPKPSGALDLAGCAAKPKPESDRPFTIRIETRDRPYHLAAASGDEMSEWLLCLQYNASRGK